VLDSAWVALSLADHVGGKKLRALLRHFDGDLSAILAADAGTLRQVPGVGPKTAAIIGALRPAALEPALHGWQAAGVRLCGLFDADYPSQLAALDDAPPTLFAVGRWPLPQRAVAVVGTRQPSKATVEAARELGSRLAERGFAVVSGLALGIDTAAHMGALAVPGGTTLAVLGSGVLNIYPYANTQLAKAITLRGALLSEVAPNAPPNPASLVARNRIISGLSEALIVAESSADGGAMHAARRALEQGRRVYALDNGASGNRALLDAGALAIAPDLRGLVLP
jgi:DNA processing protein